MEYETRTSCPRIILFENIALTFSGGGYRASAFGLGVLSYFNHVQFNGKPLLEHVKGLSTVSGGTLTGATYAYCMADGRGFETFYSDLYRMHDEDRLLSVALEKLDSEELWKASHKRRSLANAFALAYDELLTHETFKFLKQNKSHLEDICFNATDFSFGLAFRFQVTGRFGNYRLNGPNLKQLANNMKISDAIAASSCFPIGFEPIIMPDDFVSDHKSEAYLAIKAQKEYEKGVGIMDGGIVDNQGIGSIINAEVRRVNEGNSYDLIMVCDVGSYFMEPWEASKIVMERIGWAKSPIQLFHLLVEKLKLSWWLWLPSIISIVLLISGFMNRPAVGLFIAGGAMAMFAVFAIALKLLIGKMEEKSLQLWDWIIRMVPKFMKDKIVRFQNLKLRLIQRMFEERGTSSLKMISDIFLKQIRRLNYDLLYKDECLKNRRITTLIYELTQEQFQQGVSDEKLMDVKDEQITEPGDLIFASAKIACEMDSTLWFTEKDREVDRLKNLVSCGQYTACYNLLKYCMDLKKNQANIDPQLLDQMIHIFQTDWNEFIKDPYHLHDDLLEEKDMLKNVG